MKIMEDFYIDKNSEYVVYDSFNIKNGSILFTGSYDECLNFIKKQTEDKQYNIIKNTSEKIL